MTRATAVAALALALVAGAALRFARLDARPMHHDEANQAIKFGALLERGEYRYDPHDHHGPTLYYLALSAAALRGQTTLAALDERTLRGLTAAFGVATILLLPLLSAGLGRTAVVVAAWLLALSPAMVFYSRMFIQESLFACFTLAFAIALGRAATGGGTMWAAWAGTAAGLAIATKETSIIVIPAALAACVLARLSLGQSPWPRTNAPRRRSALVAVTAAAGVAALFYSSFFSAPSGILEPFRGIPTYLDRAAGEAEHTHPWHYYFSLLAYTSSGGLRWTESLVLGLAVVGLVAAWATRDTGQETRTFWARYIGTFTVIAAVVFSAIPYKTPWNLLPFYAGAIVLAGTGFSTLVHAANRRAARAALAVGLALASAHLGWQAWRASVTYAADERNPYVYAQTVPDAVRMAERIRTLATLHPDGTGMQVSVIAAPHEQWPAPWYLRTLPHVGYWTVPGDPVAVQAPVIVASMDHAAALDESLGDRYISEFYGLRPDVLLVLYVERGLWTRFLEAAGAT